MENELEAVEITEMESTDYEFSEDEDPFVIVFRKPYQFEGTEYTEVDLSGIENLTGFQYIQISKEMDKNAPTVGVREMSPTFAVRVAAAVTKLPVEFFYKISARDFTKVKNRISRYFFAD
jgi:hypothetical protein